MKSLKNNSESIENTTIPANFFLGNIIEIPNKNTLIQNKIIDYAIYKAEYKRKKYIALFSLKELCSFEGVSYSSYNKTLRDISNTSRYYSIQGFPYPLFDKITYKNGEVKVYFNEVFYEHIEELKEYVSYDIKNMFLFKHSFTHMIYKLLYDTGKSGYVTFNLNDLRNYLFAGDNNKYDQWREFNRNILTVAKKDLDILSQYSDLLTFDYEPLLKGKGGKVDSVRFTVYYNNNQKFNASEVKVSKKAILNQDKKDVKALEKLLEKDGITTQGVRELLALTNGDIEKVENAYIYSKMYNKIFGLKDWLKGCIVYNWQEVLSNPPVLCEQDEYFMIKYISIYEIYLALFKPTFSWGKFMNRLFTFEITYNPQREEHQLLLSEIIAHIVKGYLECDIPFNAIKKYVEITEYDISSVIDKFKMLKCCNMDYRLKYFNTYINL